MIDLSILIPMYNCESTISRALDSVVSQQASDIEVVLIDDGSSDRTALKCEPYLKAYPWIHYHVYPNGGVSKARNRALALAQGRYVMFLDSDDEIPNGFLRQLLAVIAAGNHDIIFFDFAYRTQGKLIPSSAGMESGSFMMDGCDEAFIKFFNALLTHCIGAKAYRKALIDREVLRFDEHHSIYEDALFTIEFLNHADHGYYLHQCGYVYDLDQQNSLMHTKKHKFVEALNYFYQELRAMQNTHHFRKETLDYFDLKYIQSTVDLFVIEKKTDHSIDGSLSEIQQANRINMKIPMDPKFKIYCSSILHHWNFLTKWIIDYYTRSKK